MIFADSDTGKPVVSVSLLYAGIGDLVMATGAMGAFHDRHPETLLDIYAHVHLEVFWNLPFVRRLQTPLLGRMAVAMMPAGPPGDTPNGTLARFYEALQVDDVPVSKRRMRYNHAPGDCEYAHTQLTRAGWQGQPLIGVQWRGGKASKAWAGVLALCRLLVREGYFVVITSDKALPIDEPGIAVLWTFYNVRELASIQSHMQCYVGFDSGPTHLAAAIGIPTVWLFSATDPRYLIEQAGANAPFRVVWPRWWEKCLSRHGTNCRVSDVPGVMAEGRYCPFRLGEEGADCLDAQSPAMILAEVHALLEQVEREKHAQSEKQGETKAGAST